MTNTKKITAVKLRRVVARLEKEAGVSGTLDFLTETVGADELAQLEADERARLGAAIGHVARAAQAFQRKFKKVLGR